MSRLHARIALNVERLKKLDARRAEVIAELDAWDRLRRALLRYRVNRIAAKDLAWLGTSERSRMHYRTGVPGKHSMSAAALASWALGIAEAHQPNEHMAEAIVDLPEGLWFDFESSAPVADVMRP